MDDFTPDEIQYLIDLAIEIKHKQKSGEVYQPLKGKTIGLIFEKSSTRTRVSFEVGAFQLGAHALFLSKNDIQLGRGEIISDTAQVLSRYLDGMMIRTFGHENVIDLASYATVPVINGLSDLAHPCQVLADYQTVFEHKGTLKGLKLAYIGDGNNMAHSLMIGGAKLGVHVSVATPEGYEPDASVVKECLEIARRQDLRSSLHTVHKKRLKTQMSFIQMYGLVWDLKKSRRFGKLLLKTIKWMSSLSKALRVTICSCTVCQHIVVKK